MFQRKLTSSQIARAHAATLLRARADLIDAGGDDETVQDIEQLANADFLGSTDAAGQQLIDEVRLAVRRANDEQRTAREDRQARLNSPEMRAASAEMYDCLRRAGELEAKATGATGRNRDEAISRLIAQGVAEAEAERAVGGRFDAQALLAEARELRTRALILERKICEA